MRSGHIDHSDSLGATARFGQGDCQWMTAGRGIEHCEMFPLLHADRRNPLELFQIWLNLPRAGKLVEPYFTMLWGGSIPRHSEVNAGGTEVASVTVVAGAFRGLTPPSPPPDSWAAAADNEVRAGVWHPGRSGVADRCAIPLLRISTEAPCSPGTLCNASHHIAFNHARMSAAAMCSGISIGLDRLGGVPRQAHDVREGEIICPMRARGDVCLACVGQWQLVCIRCVTSSTSHGVKM